MIRLTRSVVLAMGLTTAPLLVTGQAARTVEQTVLRVENDSIDVGRLIAGKTATATYVFHNDGTTDINIVRASPS
jgi:hypothetical protein